MREEDEPRFQGNDLDSFQACNMDERTNEEKLLDQIAEQAATIKRLEADNEALTARVKYLDDQCKEFIWGESEPKEWQSHQDTIAKLQAQLDKQNWVSVEDRLPENSDEVLIYCPAGGIRTNRLYPEGWFSHDKTYRSYPEYQTTHWMPLPSPPEV